MSKEVKKQNGVSYFIGGMAFVALFAAIIMFIWDMGVTWAFPSARYMGYWQAVALSLAFVGVNGTVSFWFQKVTKARQASQAKQLEQNIMSMLFGSNAKQDK